MVCETNVPSEDDEYSSDGLLSDKPLEPGLRLPCSVFQSLVADLEQVLSALYGSRHFLRSVGNRSPHLFSDFAAEFILLFAEELKDLADDFLTLLERMGVAESLEGSSGGVEDRIKVGIGDALTGENWLLGDGRDGGDEFGRHYGDSSNNEGWNGAKCGSRVEEGLSGGGEELWRGLLAGLIATADTSELASSDKLDHTTETKHCKDIRLLFACKL